MTVYLFKRGDRVVMRRPVNSYCETLLGLTYEVVNDQPEGSDVVYVQTPRWGSRSFTASQFDLEGGPW